MLAKQNQQMDWQSVHDSLMADLYYGTPIGLDNNSGEFNVTAQQEVATQTDTVDTQTQ